MRQRQMKLIYANHRPPPWLTEDAARDRSNRLLGVTMRASSNYDVCNRGVHDHADRKASNESQRIERSAFAKWMLRYADSDARCCALEQ